MALMSRRKLVDLLGQALVVLGLMRGAMAQGPKIREYRRADVDMPVSLAVGTVRTPAFQVIPEAYYIMVQVFKPFPRRDMESFHQWMCWMAMASGPWVESYCNNEPPLLQATWRVLDEGRVVATGTSPLKGGSIYESDYMIKIIGQFLGEAGRKYLVEVNFTNDGTPLNAGTPHLIVIRIRYH